jgi:hypothetical protein
MRQVEKRQVVARQFGMFLKNGKLSHDKLLHGKLSRGELPLYQKLIFRLCTRKLLVFFKTFGE